MFGTGYRSKRGETRRNRNIFPEKLTTEFFRLSSPVFLAAGLIANAGTTLAQTTVISDAQIESNVLKALAGAQELASEAITTRTVYGVVTLSGTVQTETQRRRAEMLASNAAGVKKVVDQLTLGTSSTAPQGANTDSGNPASSPGPNMVLQSDGTYAPAIAEQSAPQPQAGMPVQPQRNNPEADQELDRQMEAQHAQQSGQQPADADNNRRPINGSPQYPQGTYPPYPQNGYPQTQNGYPQNQNGYPQNQNGYPQAQGYPQYPNYPQSGYPQANQPGYSAHGYAAPMDGGQVAGKAVTIPGETLIRVRVNQNLSSNHSQPGTSFDGIVVNDVVAGGVIAIPRGAAIRGTVVDAKASGALKGRGEMTLQLNQLTLAGKTYPIVSDNWTHNGGDKTIETVNKTVGFGAVGALIGAVAGGGVGAAVGGGVGAAAGLGSSAASGRGQVYVPSEAVVTFHLAQPANIQTVSEQEMQRLAYGVAPGADARYARRVYPRPYPYYAPYPPVYPAPY